MQKPTHLLPLLLAFTCQAIAGVVPEVPKIDYDSKKPQALIDFRFAAMDGAPFIQRAVLLGFGANDTVGAEIADAQFTPFSSLEDHSVAVAFVLDYGARNRSPMKDKDFMRNTVQGLAQNSSSTQTGVFALGVSLATISPLVNSSGAALDKLSQYKPPPNSETTSHILQNLKELIDAHLVPSSAKRKVIVLLTDGQDSSRAAASWQWDNRLTELTATCKKLDIAVHVIGLAQKSNVSAKEYTWLKEFTNNTGGTLAAATINEQVPDEEMKKIVPSFTSGGRVSADMSKLVGKTHWQIKLVGQNLQSYPLPATKQPASASTDPTKPDPTKPDPTKPDPTKPDPTKPDPTKPDPTKPVPLWMNPWVWVGVAVPLFLLFLLVLLLIFRKKPESVSPLVMTPDEPTHIIAPQFGAPPVGGARKPLAWLEMMDAEGSRETLSSTNVRIGRGKDNDLVLSNKSVSSHHCVIQQARDGTWSVNDLKSGNGVYLNDRRVEHNDIRDGDVIELGEVKMRFRTGN